MTTMTETVKQTKSLLYLVTLGRQIKNDFARDAISTKQRLEKLVELLLNIHSPVNFKVSVSKLNEVYPCPSIHSFSHSGDKVENRDCLNYIICYGESVSSFKQELSHFDDSKVCGRVWTHNFLAYRCKTCALSPCMSLCNDCFNNANHVGHDYNMFRSQAGGACDCGDENVLKSSGFCSQHGGQKNGKEVPEKLLSSAKVVLPHMLLRLITCLRSNLRAFGRDFDIDEPTNDFNQIVAWLEELALIGQAMRKVICDLMLSTDCYTQMTNHMKKNDRHSISKALDNFQLTKNFEEIMRNGPPLRMFPIKNFLEEIFFWSVQFCLPQPLTTFFLNLLPDVKYKVEFARVFLRHYPALTMSLLENESRIDTISNRIVHMSVQLFSNESLALEMVLSEDDVLHVLLTCMSYMIERLSDLCTVFEGAFHACVDVSQTVVAKHCYWAIFSDFLNLLAHSSVVEVFLTRKQLIEKYSSIVESFCGMNALRRAIDEHVEYDHNEQYISAFSVEIEACSFPIWSMLPHINSQKLDVVADVLRILHTDILNTVTACGIDIDSCELFCDHLSFHWPLHRTFVILLTKVLNEIKDSSEAAQSLTQKIGLTPETMKQVMFAPLHLLCRVNEINSNMWVRNGLSIIQQASTYIQPHFSHSLVDADLLLTQLAVTFLDADYFLTRLLKMQTLDSWFTVDLESKVGRVPQSSEYNLIELLLRLIALIVNSRLSLGIDNETFCLGELMALLSVKDRPYSQLMDIVSEKVNHYSSALNENNDFKETTETLMELLAVFSPPGLQSGGIMRQGIYQLTLQSWLLYFDPLHTSLRCMRKSEFQEAMQRYSKTMFSGGYCSQGDNLWPPYVPLKPICAQYKNVLNILQTKTLNGMLFCLFYKTVHLEKDKQVPESLLALAVHLFSLSLDYLEQKPAGVSKFNERSSVKSSTKGSSFFVVDEFKFDSWFPSNNVLVNSAVVIDAVNVNSSEKSTDTENDGFELIFTPNLSLRENSIGNGGGTKNESSAKSSAKTIKVGESMLSLLVKVHNKMCNGDVSKEYSLNDINDAHIYHHNYKCGTALHQLKLLLARIVKMSSECSEMLKYIVASLNPINIAPNSSITSHKSDFNERKKRARERNKALMKSMQNKQKMFLEANYDSVIAAVNETNADTDNGEDASSNKKCVICNQVETPSYSQVSDPALVSSSSLSSSANLSSSGSRNRTSHLLRSSGAGESNLKGGVEEDYLVIMAFGQILNNLSKRCVRADSIDQVNNLLGAMDQNDGSSSTSSSIQKVRAADVYKKRLSSYFDLFGGTEVVPSFLDSCSSHGGTLVISMCDHIAHNSCINKYKEILKINDDEHSSGISTRTFDCPVCRKKCNFTVPILDIDSTNNTVFSTTDPLDKSTRFDRVLSAAIDQIFSKELALVPKRIFDSNSSSTFSADPIYQISMVLYYSILFELTTLNKNQLKPKIYSSEINQGASFYNLMLNIQRFYRNFVKANGESVTRQSVNVLSDSFLVLISKLLQTSLDGQTFETVLDNLVLEMLKNELACQLFEWAFQLSSDERAAWRGRVGSSEQGQGGHYGGKKQTVTTALSAVSFVLDHFAMILEKSNFESVLYSSEHGTSSNSQLTSDCSISAVIWSEKSLESFLQSQTKHFLQLCVLFKSRLLHRPIEDKHLTDLLSYFNITQQNLLDIQFENPAKIVNNLMESIVDHKTKTSSDIQKLKSLLMLRGGSKDIYDAPKLIDLPDEYYELYSEYRSRKCSSCNTTPVNISVCLICGDLLCVQEKCCRKLVPDAALNTNSVHRLLSRQDRIEWCEASSHAHQCGNGIGVVLMLTTSQVLILFNHTAAIWGCLHLDSHGEEDKELRRGKPLFLSHQRYEMLNDQWVRLKFDNAHITFFNHLNKL